MIRMLFFILLCLFRGFFFRWEATSWWMKVERSSSVTLVETLWTGRVWSTSCGPFNPPKCDSRTGWSGRRHADTTEERTDTLAWFNDVTSRTHEAMMRCGWSTAARQRHVQDCSSRLRLRCFKYLKNKPWRNNIFFRIKLSLTFLIVKWLCVQTALSTENGIFITDAGKSWHWIRKVVLSNKTKWFDPFTFQALH